jgi:thioesterase domain-containing protein/acyl carrier protein
LSDLLTKPAWQGDSPLLARLRDTPAAQRPQVLVSHLQRELQQILGLAAAPDPDGAFFDLGLDSLMAVELRNRLRAQLGNGLALPPTFVFDYPNVRALADYLAVQQVTPTPTHGSSTAEAPPGPRRACWKAVAREAPSAIGAHAGHGTPHSLVFLLPGALGLHPRLQQLGALPQFLQTRFYRLDLVDAEADPIQWLNRIELQCAEICQQSSVGFQLIGESIGGLIAVELASRLIARGLTPAQVLMLDSRVDPESLRAVQHEAAQIDAHLGCYMNYLANCFTEESDPEDRVGRAFWEVLRDNGFVPEDVAFSSMACYLRLGSKPPTTHRAVTLAPRLFRATDVAPDLSRDHGWRAYYPDLRIIDVPGSHFTMYSGEHWKTAARAIAECIAERAV